MKKRNAQELVQNCQHSRLKAALMAQMPQAPKLSSFPPQMGAQAIAGEVAALREAPAGSDTRFYTNFLLLTIFSFFTHFVAQVVSF